MDQMDNSEDSDTNDVELDARRDPVADRRSFIKRMAMVAGATAVVPAIASFALGSSAKPKSVAFAGPGGFTNGASNTEPPIIVNPTTTTTTTPPTTTPPTTTPPTTTLAPTTTTTVDTAGSGGAELPPTE